MHYYALGLLLLALPMLGQSSCSSDQDEDDWTTADGDCDDTNPDVYPGAPEVCDGVDNDCNAEVDEGVSATYYLDQDQDGYGDNDVAVQACGLPDGYVTTGGDCDDTNASISPDASETCDDLDNDCDGLVDGDDPDSGTSCQECGDSVLDQSQLVASYQAGFGTDYFGQSFTVGKTGQLTGISTQVMSSGSGELRIYSGGISGVAPSGMLIYQQSVSWTGNSSGTVLAKFSLTTPLNVNAGEVYTWQLYSGAGINGYVSDNVYSGGRALAYEGYDHPFQTSVASCE